MLARALYKWCFTQHYVPKIHTRTQSCLVHSLAVFHGTGVPRFRPQPTGGAQWFLCAPGHVLTPCSSQTGQQNHTWAAPNADSCVPPRPSVSSRSLLCNRHARSPHIALRKHVPHRALMIAGTRSHSPMCCVISHSHQQHM